MACPSPTWPQTIGKPTTQMFGREDEREYFVKAVTKMRYQSDVAASSMVVMVEAEAGMGKTRLVEEVRMRACASVYVCVCLCEHVCMNVLRTACV